MGVSDCVCGCVGIDLAVNVKAVESRNAGKWGGK